MAKRFRPIVTARKKVVDNQFLVVYKDTITVNKNTHAYFWVDVFNGVSIVAINAQKQICLIKVYRHASGKTLWGLPSGGIEKGESPLKAAKRELLEEAGIKAKTWKKLGEFAPSPGFIRQTSHYFLAQDVTVVPTSHEELELIQIQWKSIPQIKAMIQKGEIIDVWALVPLLRALPLLS